MANHPGPALGSETSLQGRDVDATSNELLAQQPEAWGEASPEQGIHAIASELAAPTNGAQDRGVPQGRPEASHVFRRLLTS